MENFPRLTPEQRARVIISGEENTKRLFGLGQNGAWYRIGENFAKGMELTVGDIEDQLIKIIESGEWKLVDGRYEKSEVITKDSKIKWIAEHP